jgi:hypothetical protein
MIEYLAKGEAAKFAEMAKYDLSYVEHLVGYGLITRRGDDYEFSFAAVEDAVKKTINTVVEGGISEKWATISKRRNSIEEEIRGVLYQWSMRLGANEWTESVKACLTDKRRTELGPLTRPEAFSKNRSKLYFLELLQFLRYSSLYNNVQGASGGDIFRAMDVVNKSRIDAHAQDISESEYGELLEALDTLENIFVPP